jgi:FtsP/CotA-like multicopper oxidase with cupredoxin domain
MRLALSAAALRVIFVFAIPLLGTASTAGGTTARAQETVSPDGGAYAGQDGLTTYSSSDGLLEVTLTAAAGRLHVGDLDLDGATYNGSYAGPVLRTHPGDLLCIHLINHLTQSTNLHFHGIRTSPQGNSDNAHLSIAPGARFTYEVRIPSTQPPGVYWYHAHPHGQSETQVMQGLSGTLLVDGPTSAVPQRIFVLKDMTFDDDTGNPRIDAELHGIVQSINGNLDVSVSLAAGEAQVWSFANESANRAVHLALEAHRFRIVSRDGEAITGLEMADTLDIMPSARISVLVQGDTPGRYGLIARGLMTGTKSARQPDRVLGYLDVTPQKAADDEANQIGLSRGALARTSPIESSPGPASVDLRALTPDAKRVVVFTQTQTLDPDKQKFFINGLTYDNDRVDFRVPLGAVEEWTVRNDTDDLHVFHIHQVGFQVIDINGSPAPFEGYVDTVKVPERGTVTVRMAFTDPVIVGRFMFHCHVLKHEDRGMMAQIEIYDPSPPRLIAWLQHLYIHVWWWLNGIPWKLCGT